MLIVPDLPPIESIRNSLKAYNGEYGMKDIVETKEEKYTQLKKKLEKQGFLAKRLIRVMRYKYKCYFGTELSNGDALLTSVVG